LVQNVMMTMMIMNKLEILETNNLEELKMAENKFNEILLSLKPSMEAFIRANIKKYTFLVEAEPDDVIQNCICTCLKMREREDEIESLGSYFFGVIKKSLQTQNNALRREREVMKKAFSFLSRSDALRRHDDSRVNYIRHRIKQAEERTEQSSRAKKSMLAVWDALVLTEGDARVAGKMLNLHPRTVRKYRSKAKEIYQEVF